VRALQSVCGIGSPKTSAVFMLTKVDAGGLLKGKSAGFRLKQSINAITNRWKLSRKSLL
jgi:hypothetical protein